jgi:holo-[acyl-carrier protein] synthase
VFTAWERETAGGFREPRRSEFLAGRFAAKEAVLKALGTGISGDDVHLSDVEVRMGAAREPLPALSGGAGRAARELGLSTCQVSITHDGGFALAFAVLT